MPAAVETLHSCFPSYSFREGILVEEKPANLVKTVDVSLQIKNIADIKLFSKWFQDEESAKHFDPKFDTLEKCYQYYQNPEMPNTLFLTARDSENNPIAVTTIKPRDEYFNRYISFVKESADISNDEIKALENINIAYLEKTIVNPSLQSQGIGRTLLATTLDFIFQTAKYDQCDLWIMAGQPSGKWDRNLDFFTKAGFLFMHHKYSLWTIYSEEILKKKVKTQALWLYTTPELWLEVKLRDQKLKKPKLNAALLKFSI